MKKVTTTVAVFILFIFISWARGGVDAEAEALDIASLSEGQYVWFSEQELEKAEGKNKVLFFHAAWCPTCRSAQKDILSNYSLLDSNTVIFKTNYDKEKDLKRKYGISNQHTFVIVDDHGEALSIWYGGGVERIIEEINKI